MVEEGAGGAARRVGPRDSVPRDAALLVPRRSLASKEIPTGEIQTSTIFDSQIGP